ncbi:hypothetical protein [Rikenella microfusus]|uniref:hypothetical protein n=1 Tax=Rikenella microfusus TaxID=28139 RepID=UPI00248D580A|nr:hypothetical protein [Rikenella microfusus]
MFRFYAIRICCLGTVGCLSCGLPATAAAFLPQPVAADSAAACVPPAAIRADALTETFIRAGEMVAERDIALFTADLLDTYKILKGDERNLTRLFLRCEGNWGATAYALALQAASRVPMRTVLMNYDAADRNWERTAVDMGMLYKGSRQPSYTFGVYLDRQQEVWRKVLDGPVRWRRTFLGR